MSDKSDTKTNIDSYIINKSTYLKYCRPDKLDNCISHIDSMYSLLENFDEYRTTLQGTWLRDVYGIKNFVTDILSNRFDFDINFEEINLEKEHKECKTSDNSNNFIKKMTDFIEKLIKNKIYFVYVLIESHVNLHYINTYDNTVYLYEPHQPVNLQTQNKQYCSYINSQQAYTAQGYKILELPKNILTQTNLPLCYMYVLHFFMYAFISTAQTKRIKKYEYKEYDNVYVMSFTKYILKLCHEYNKISDIDYYALTNNVYKIQTIHSPDIFKNILQFASSDEMIKYLIKNIKNIELHIPHPIFFIDNVSFKGLLDTITSINIYNDHFNNHNNQYIKNQLIFVIGIIFLYKNRNLANETIIIKTLDYEKLTAHDCDFFINKITFLNGPIIVGVLKIPEITLPVLTNIINYLLKLNIDVDQQDNEGTTALMRASIEYIQIVELLVPKTKNINMKNMKGETALTFATESNEPNIVHVLLEAKADANVQIELENNLTPLMIASRDNFIDVFNFLLPKVTKPNINALTKDGKTALMLASEEGNDKIVRLLINNNAKIDLKSHDGKTALQFAINNNHDKVIKLFKRYDDKLKSLNVAPAILHTS